jgi:hypothetical protein
MSSSYSGIGHFELLRSSAKLPVLGEFLKNALSEKGRPKM